MKCGYIAIIGRPNVGKSTLINSIFDTKMSIISRRPQTTRHHIICVKTLKNSQMILIDTPGLHLKKNATLNTVLNKNAESAMLGADIILFVVEAGKLTTLDKMIMGKLKSVSAPIIVVINKLDTLKDKSLILSQINDISQSVNIITCIPVSAKRQKYISSIEKEIIDNLPEADFMYDTKVTYTRTDEFYISELIREKIMQQMGDEIPYSCHVITNKIEKIGKSSHIFCQILVERESQKAMILGSSGQRLSRLGREARIELENKFNSKIVLHTHVKVQKKWSTKQAKLAEFGYANKY